MLAVIKKNANVINFRLAKADRAHHKFTLSLAVLCFFFFPIIRPMGFRRRHSYL